MKNKSIHLLTLITAASVLVSCGKENGRSPSAVEKAEDAAAMAAKDGSNIQGSYLAKFITMNSHVVGTIPGSAHLKRDDDQLFAFLRLFAGSPDIAHFQNIHTGNRCPDLRDDSNGDGYIDYQEALAVVGPVIIPLDWDISSQASGNRSWPKAFPNGSYEYLKITNFNRFWDDLKNSDRNPDDHIVKLAPDEGLAITGKVVLVQGVGEDKMLPDTVAGNGKYKHFQTLPIACGVFMPSTEMPGVDYEESIPGPVGPVIEGQDTPAPEGEGEIPGTGTVITGPSNETGEDNSTPTDTPSDEEPSTTPTTPSRPTSDETDDDEGGWDWRWPWET